MQLTATSRPPPPSDDLASALSTAATHLGHRPALTVLRTDRRDEQGFRSLAKWASKGAHLLELELGLGPGDRLRLDAPAGWPAAAVCFAAWWIGVVVTDGPAEVSVVDEPEVEAVGDAYAVGGALDGSPVGPSPIEPWPIAVQTFPDQPPVPRASPDTPAVDVAGRRWTHHQLLEEARGWDDGSVIGVAAGAATTVWLPTIVRPLVAGRPTVILAGADRAAAAAEGVTTWT